MRRKLYKLWQIHARVCWLLSCISYLTEESVVLQKRILMFHQLFQFLNYSNLPNSCTVPNNCTGLVFFKKWIRIHGWIIILGYLDLWKILTVIFEEKYFGKFYNLQESYRKIFLLVNDSSHMYNYLGGCSLWLPSIFISKI